MLRFIYYAGGHAEAAAVLKDVVVDANIISTLYATKYAFNLKRQINITKSYSCIKRLDRVSTSADLERTQYSN